MLGVLLRGGKGVRVRSLSSALLPQDGASSRAVTLTSGPNSRYGSKSPVFAFYPRAFRIRAGVRAAEEGDSRLRDSWSSLYTQGGGLACPRLTRLQPDL